MRTSSPSSKSTMQIGHVSRPIASGSGSASAEVTAEAADGPARRRGGGRSASSSWLCSTPFELSMFATCVVSGSAASAASPPVSCISCPGCCPSPRASKSFASLCLSASARRAPNLIRGNVSMIARVRTPPRPGPPTSPAPAAAR